MLKSKNKHKGESTMDRSKVIVHMYVSIDGKIDGPYGSAFSSSYYSDELFRLINADGNGRETIQMYAAPGQPDLSKFDASGIEYEDWLPEIKSESWSVAFDRKGKDGWQQNYFEYNGHKMHAIEVVTKQAKRESLAFLRSMKIPYIVSGDTDFNLEEVLVKLKQHYQINTLAVCGGSVIDGVFLKAHLVDEISLVVAPHVSGDRHQKAAFDTLGSYVDDTFAIKTVKKLADGGLHLIFAKQ
jgi:riboflavin biosynthesis pyrimidine reductase